MKKHVLIMDDDISLSFEWRDEFERHGHAVTLCHSGEEAIAHLEETRFDLVITDLFVPNRKGGIHVAGTLYAMEAAKPPIIAVTGARRHIDGSEKRNFFLQQVRKLGVSDTLEKPFAPEKLVSLAEHMWDRGW